MAKLILVTTVDHWFTE